MIFELQRWHALAKLRLHSDKTLEVFEAATKTLGETLRNFQRTTCKHYDTRDLPSEEAARGRRKVALAKKGKGKASASGNKTKILNLQTYKWHALGDYVSSIRKFGTTDNYSTQIVSLFLQIAVVACSHNSHSV